MRRSGFKRVKRGIVLVSGIALWVGVIAAPGPASSLTTDQMETLDATVLSEPVQSAITTVVAAFQAFDLAGRSLTDGAEETELSSVRTARESLLDAAMALDAAVATAPASTATPAAVGPCAFDLVGVANTYAVDCQLLIDVGGDDRYTNNAGGSSGIPAALIDLAGNDSYSPSSGRGGTNGGASGGAGFLYDGDGQDVYSAANTGTNGGGYFFGLGFLLDRGSGNDRYTAGQGGTNGGGSSLGEGVLIDMGGSDSYTATYFGVNGGADSGVRGLLLDAGGTDTYSDKERCTGSGIDRTVVPKGGELPSGAQIDQGSSRPIGSCLPTTPSPPGGPAVGSVAGRVTDAQTRAALPGAIVDCSGLPNAGVSLVDGRYTIPVVGVGTHTCTARAVGYGVKTQTVTVAQGATTTADFALRKER
jgi:hypothetical protein